MTSEITPAELQALLDRDDPVQIVDIRSAPGFRRGHIPGSINVPFPELTTRVEEFTDAERIVTVCPHGKSSIQAANLINSYEGIDSDTAASLAGGLHEWDGPVETTAGERSESAENSERDASGGPSAPF